jgi:hypothetical protein
MLDKGFEINAIAGILGVPLDVILNIQKLWLCKKTKEEFTVFIKLNSENNTQ